MNKKILKEMLKDLLGNVAIFGVLSVIVGTVFGVFYGVWKGVLLLFGEKTALIIVIVAVGLMFVAVIFGAIQDWYRNAKRKVEFRDK